MPQHQQEKDINIHAAVLVTGIPQIVARHIASVMVDRSRMQAMENELDIYLKNFSNEDKQAKREEIKKQLTDGRLALESLLQRFLSS